jgi:hypothetical protein
MVRTWPYTLNANSQVIATALCVVCLCVGCDDTQDSMPVTVFQRTGIKLPPSVRNVRFDWYPSMNFVAFLRFEMPPAGVDAFLSQHPLLPQGPELRANRNVWLGMVEMGETFRLPWWDLSRASAPLCAERLGNKRIGSPGRPWRWQYTVCLVPIEGDSISVYIMLIEEPGVWPQERLPVVGKGDN